jgi:hypothetical protein
MGMIEIVVALCLQAEPAACRINRETHLGAATTCLMMDAENGGGTEIGWYRARFSCRWRVG